MIAESPKIAKLKRIGIIGNFPLPYGGVATTCYQLVSNLIADRNEIFFYDKLPNSEKMLPEGLTRYRQKRHYSIGAFLMSALSVISAFVFSRTSRAMLTDSVATALRFKAYRRSPRALVRLAFEVLALQEYFRDLDIDIIHAHHASRDAFAALMVSRHMLSCPFVVTVYASEFTMSKNVYWRDVSTYICTEASAVMCISEYTRRQMLTYGATPSISQVIRLGADPRHFAERNTLDCIAVRQQHNFLPDTPVILYVGWLIERKGPHVLVQALSRIRDLTWQAVFVGPNTGTRELFTELCIELGLNDRIQVLGEVEFQELATLYDAANLFVFPTLSADEGFGLVALEAMAHGLPVIASRSGAIPEIVLDHETGLLFDVGDDIALADHLRYLLNHPIDGARMGETGRLYARNEYSWKKSASELLALYDLLDSDHA